MWTINEFSAYGMLSGWRTLGRLACPHYMEHHKSFTLNYGRKTCWFDSHRRFLPIDHPFRKNVKAFRKGKVETDGPPPRPTPTQVWRSVKDLPKITESGATMIDEYGEWHKNYPSILFTLNNYNTMKKNHITRSQMTYKHKQNHK